MKVYTDSQVRKLIKSFNDFCKEKGYATCDFRLPEIESFEIDLTDSDKQDCFGKHGEICNTRKVCNSLGKCISHSKIEQ